MFGRIQSLTSDELLALLRAARDRSERDWLMILVAFWHGLRATEVVGGWHEVKEARKKGDSKDLERKKIRIFHPGIRPCDIVDGFLTIDRLKGSNRTVQALVDHPEPLLSERDALIEYASKTPLNQPVFKVCRQHFWRLIQRYAKIAGIPKHKAHPHALKHTIAMQMIEKAGIHKTRQRLGHKSISSTGEYLKVSDEDVDAVVVGATGL